MSLCKIALALAIALSAASSSARGQETTDPELQAWNDARNSSDASLLSAFLSRFPNSVFVPLVKRRLDALQASSVAAAKSKELDELWKGDLHNKEFVEAKLRPVIEEILKADPNNATALFRKGYLTLDANDNEGAEQLFTRSISFDPNRAAAYWDRGIARQSQHNFKEALIDLTKAIELRHPLIASIYAQRGTCYEDYGKSEQAMADYTEAIKLNPKLALPYYRRGRLLTRWADLKENADTEKGLADFAEALKIDPDYWSVYWDRGFALRTLKRYSEALADYGQMIRLQPNSLDAHQLSGETRIDMKDWVGARQDLEAALKIDSNSWQAHFYLAGVEKNEGHPEAVIEHCRRVAEIRGRNESIWTGDWCDGVVK